MRREDLREFAERWPDWFDFDGPATQTLMKFGFDGVGEGWRQILWDLFSEMESHVVVLNRELAAQNPLEDFEVLQVKEKFGGLRVYANHTNPGIESCIARASEEALHTCRICGNEGRLRDQGWWGVYCDRCHRQ